MKFLYARCSTQQQNLDRQLTETEKYDRVYMEKVSAKSKDRPELQALLSNLRAGDQIEVHSLDRLARNLKDLLSIVEEIQRKGCSVYFLKENLKFEAGSTDPFQKMTLSLLGTFAEFERSILLERQKEGIAIAQAKGKYRKPHIKKLNPVDIERVRQDKADGMRPKDIIAKYKIGRSTLYEYLQLN